MKRSYLTGIAVAITMTIGAHTASAGGWATVGQGSTIISQLRALNQNQVQTGKNVEKVEQQIQDAADRIIAALKGHSGEQSAYQDKQIEASKRIADAEQQNDSERMRQEFRARAESGEFDPSPAICLLAGLFSGSGSSSDNDDAIGTKVVDGARYMISGGDPAVVAGGTQLAKSISDNRAALADAVPGFSDATTNAAVILQQPTLPFSGGQGEQAAQVLARNLINPFPDQPITASELGDPNGVARAAAQNARDTRNNAAAALIAMVMDMRAPVGSSAPYKPYVEDIADYNRTVGSQISELQGIDIRTLRHYAPSAETSQKRAAMNDKALLQEILDAISINARINYLQLELDSRRATVEAQILSALNNG